MTFHSPKNSFNSPNLSSKMIRMSFDSSQKDKNNQLHNVPSYNSCRSNAFMGLV